jgi:predicted porin
LDSGTLVEGHIQYQRGGFGLRALYARWDFNGYAVEEANADKQWGWYIEPSYRINEIGFYTRYEKVDAARAQDQFDQWEVGLNWWPNENVVFKFDYRDRSHDLLGQKGRDFTGFDLGVGYSF